MSPPEPTANYRAPALEAAEVAGAEPVSGGLVRDARGMAIATIASRITGFARIVALTAVLGVHSLRQAFEVANTLPNTLYELLLGGILTSTLVPLLVEAKAGGPAKAAAFAQRILTLTILATAALSGLAIVAAPVLVRAYNTSADPDEIALSIHWARFFLPQIFFYALTATISAVLNTHARFGAAVWAPVLNNAVVIATVGVFALLPTSTDTTVSTLTSAQLLTLGIGTTLGVVAMTVALLPALHATGFRWRLQLNLRGVGLGRMARMGSWVLVYVGSTQLAFWVLTRLITAVNEQPIYVSAFTVWQLPHAVVAVSIITALLPRMSAHAVAGRLAELRSDLDRGLRLSMIALLPAAVALIVLGRDLATALFNHGATDRADAQRIGWVLAVFAVGLLPFSLYQLQARAFYALRDTKTPALVQSAVSAVLIGTDLLLAAVLPLHWRVFGLAAGHAGAYLIGVLISAAALHRRLGPRADAAQPLLTLLTRLVPAALLAGAVAAGLAAVLHPHLPAGPFGALIVLSTAAPLAVLVYLATLVVLRVPEARAGLRALHPRR
ncbi:MAG TPA: murein biosynthesis integral membrane protein MurJ [Kineosporiaceae bacterium]|nr:murein biosynthesis integral membrane protein MurJ [Kineosporiaceae bacterium]